MFLKTFFSNIGRIVYECLSISILKNINIKKLDKFRFF